MAFTDAMKTKGLYRAEVRATERVSPHVVRVTIAGDDLRRLPARGFDHWFRLFLPVHADATDFTALPSSFGYAGYLRYLTTKSGTRPACRSYTARDHRPDAGELDIDFVVHGDQGIAGIWAQRARPGEQVALIDQGRGFDPIEGVAEVLLAGDESALPAIAGVLADLPRSARGRAVIEIPDDADRQELDAPGGVEVEWIARSGQHASADAPAAPGQAALAAVRAFVPQDPLAVQAYIVGEQALAAGGRRALVAMGVPKKHITFIGYWRQGRTADGGRAPAEHGR